jgi:hypothetical protein
MVSRTASWLHETKRLMLLYLAAGVFLVPAGILYAVLVLAGWGSIWLAILCLSIGLLTVRLVWRALDRQQRVGLSFVGFYLDGKPDSQWVSIGTPVRQSPRTYLLHDPVDREVWVEAAGQPKNRSIAADATILQVA